MPRSPRTSPTASAAHKAPSNPPVPVVLVEIPRRIIAVGKPASPLAIDPPQVPREGRIVLPPIEIPPQIAAFTSITCGLWAHQADLQLVDGPRITSMDFALLALVDCWLHQVADPAQLHACDLLSDAFQHASGMDKVKQRLMGTWLQPFTPKPDFPLHNEKSFTQNFRSLDASGWISRDAQTTEMNTRYMVAPSICAIYRAHWLATFIGHQMPPVPQA